MEIDRYLERIGYRGPRTPTIETLRDLHRAHLFSVPFENLDIHLHKKIEPVEEALFRKIVDRRRGGFCYELNGLFGALLRELGYRVDVLSARVPRQDGSLGPEFDHLLLLVHLEDRCIADVGFGDSFRLPLRLESGVEQTDGSGTYRLRGNGDWSLQRQQEERWSEQYRFTLQPRALSDFAEMCSYHQTSQQSHFTQKRICSLATPDGRISLSEMRLITTAGGTRSEQLLQGEEEWQSALRDHFGLTLP